MQPHLVPLAIAAIVRRAHVNLQGMAKTLRYLDHLDYPGTSLCSCESSAWFVACAVSLEQHTQILKEVAIVSEADAVNPMVAHVL